MILDDRLLNEGEYASTNKSFEDILGKSYIHLGIA